MSILCIFDISEIFQNHLLALDVVLVQNSLGLTLPSLFVSKRGFALLAVVVEVVLHWLHVRIFKVKLSELLRNRRVKINGRLLLHQECHLLLRK